MGMHLYSIHKLFHLSMYNYFNLSYITLLVLIFLCKHLHSYHNLLIFDTESHCNFRPVKWYVTLDVKFGRENPDGSARSTTAYFRSNPAIMMNQFETQQHIEDAICRIDSLVDTFTNDGSGWTINQVGNVALHMADYDAIGGSQHILTPKWLKDKKSVVNIKNDDDKCF